MTDVIFDPSTWESLHTETNIRSMLQALDVARDAYTIEPSLQVSREIGDKQTELEPGRKTFRVESPDSSIDAKLFKNSADLKTFTAQVAMHLSQSERNVLFAGLDRLLDVDEWEEGESAYINIRSYKTFLRFLIFAHPQKPPSLGVAAAGNVLAAWRANADKVAYVEFMEDDDCVVTARGEFVRGLERMAWRGSVARLREVLEVNGFGDCID